MKAIILSILISVFCLAGNASAGDQTPAGYVVDFKLAGEDAATKTVIVRVGSEIEAKLMMPVYDRDVVFVRDAASRVALELGNGKTVTVGEGLSRYQVEGVIDTGDSTWSIIAAIGGVFAGDDDPAPENMISKGGNLKVPMALRWSNMLLRGHRSLWLGWSGGKAPYRVSLVYQAGEILLADNITSDEGTFKLPSELVKKFSIAIRDAEDQKVLVRFRVAQSLPKGAMRDTAQTTAGTLATAAWLTGWHDGAWSIEAAQLLHAANTPAASMLLEKVKTGWRYSPPR